MRKVNTDTPLFWMLSPSKRAQLLQWYWDNYGENLALPADPYRQPANIDAPDHQELQELETQKEMSKPPHSPRRVT